MFNKGVKVLLNEVVIDTPPLSFTEFAKYVVDRFSYKPYTKDTNAEIRGVTEFFVKRMVRSNLIDERIENDTIEFLMSIMEIKI